MKISFLIPAMVLCTLRESLCYDIQVGTVLFTKTDLVRKCWSESDKALLRARLIMQDVLPDPRCIDFSKPRAVSILLDYIFACFHIISTSTYGRLQNLMYLALADTVGGYLRAYVLPLTKKSFYAGLVTYEDACRVFTLYDQIREYLKTNGAGWTEPQKVIFKNIKVSPLEIVGGDPGACDILYTIEKKGKLHCINAKCCPKSSKLPDLKITEMPRPSTTEEEFMIFTEGFQFSTPLTLPPKTSIEPTPIPPLKDLNETGPVRNMKNVLRETATEMDIAADEKNISVSEKPFKRLGDLHLENETVEEFMEETNEGRNVRCDCCERKRPDNEVKTPQRIIIPLPILDDECEPHTIAVPFRKRPLRNLWKKTSAFVLEHYYVAVLQCLISKGNTRSDIKNFNSQFHSWLISEVYPRLEDEKWYPAFGGILRVTETIKRFGAEARLNEPMSHDIAFMFRKGVGFDYPGNSGKSYSKEKIRDVGDMEFYNLSKSRRYYAIVILIAGAIWFIIFCVCTFLCTGIRNKRSNCNVSAKSQTISDKPAPVSRKPNTCLTEKKAVSFQFLVRFFRKNEDQRNQHIFSNRNECPEERGLLEDLNQQNITQKKESKKQLSFKENDSEEQIISSRCGTCVSSLQKHEKPWACMARCPFERPPYTESTENADRECSLRLSSVPRNDSSKAVQTLWRNPFLYSANVTEDIGTDRKRKSWFALASKMKEAQTRTSESMTMSTTNSRTNTNRSSSPCSYSERSRNSSTSTTNCSSHTHLEDKCSSATMEFFEKVISKQKPAKKRFEQNRSTKSDTDDTCTS